MVETSKAEWDENEPYLKLIKRDLTTWDLWKLKILFFTFTAGKLNYLNYFFQDF